MIKRIIDLWKSDRNKKGTTLHRRLLLFFVLVSFCLLLIFTLILSLFGITGHGGDMVENHLSTELSIISDNIYTDFGKLSLDGISIAEEIIKNSNNFFIDNDILPTQLFSQSQYIEPLLGQNIQTLITTANNRHCGGCFILLDTSISQSSLDTKAGIFIKKTQPTATTPTGVQLHYLRGPAQLARDNGITLLGQWKMEFNILGQEFFNEVMEIARNNPDLPLSRLYYWSEKVTLKSNSESGFLLCVPLRAYDGTIFGLCGIEVSDRQFKTLYTPEGGNFENIFTIMAPSQQDNLYSSSGLIAGNYYLTGTHWNFDLKQTNTHDGFIHYEGSGNEYSGKTVQLRLYPNDSPYSLISWSVSILMPKDILHAEVKGNTPYFTYTVIGLLVLAILASIFFSKAYLKPVNKALDKIKNVSSEEEPTSSPYLEIQDLFDFLASKDNEHKKELNRLQEEKTDIQSQYDQTQTYITHLTNKRMIEVDPDDFEIFMQHLHTLTPKESEILDLYIDGKHAKEIMEVLNINQNTLKYHNKNIYSKLNVSSRKQLLEFIALMKYKKD